MPGPGYTGDFRGAEMQISDGPDKWNFFLALVDHDAFNTRKLEMKLNEAGSPAFIHTVVITGMDSENASGHCWIFRGYAYSGPKNMKRPGPPKDFEGYYHTGRRNGHLRFK